MIEKFIYLRLKKGVQIPAFNISTKPKFENPNTELINSLGSPNNFTKAVDFIVKDHPSPNFSLFEKINIGLVPNLSTEMIQAAGMTVKASEEGIKLSIKDTETFEAYYQENLKGMAFFRALYSSNISSITFETGPNNTVKIFSEGADAFTIENKFLAAGINLPTLKEIINTLQNCCDVIEDDIV